MSTASAVHRPLVAIVKELTTEYRTKLVGYCIANIHPLPDRMVPGDREGEPPRLISPYVGPTVSDGGLPHISELIDACHTIDGEVAKMLDDMPESRLYRMSTLEMRRDMSDFMAEEIYNLALWGLSFGLGNRAANPWAAEATTAATSTESNKAAPDADLIGTKRTSFVILADDVALNDRLHTLAEKTARFIAPLFSPQQHDYERYILESAGLRLVHTIFSTLFFGLFAAALRRVGDPLSSQLLLPPASLTEMSDIIRELDADNPLGDHDKAYLISIDTQILAWDKGVPAARSFDYGGYHSTAAMGTVATTPNTTDPKAHHFDTFNCYRSARHSASLSIATLPPSRARWVSEEVFNQLWAWFGMGPKVIAHPMARDAYRALKPVERPTTLTVIIEVPNAPKANPTAGGSSTAYGSFPTVTYQHTTWAVNYTFAEAAKLCLDTGNAFLPSYQDAIIDVEAVRQRWQRKFARHTKEKPKVDIREGSGSSFAEARKEAWDGSIASLAQYGTTVRLRVGPAIGKKRIFEPGHCGLTNIGNTCFMNSALQCLSNTTLLRDFIAQFAASYRVKVAQEQTAAAAAAAASPSEGSDTAVTPTTTTAPAVMNPEVTLAFADLLAQMWSGSCRSTSPADLKALFAKRVRRFAGYEQQDSIEFFNAFLDVIHEEINETRKKKYRERNDEEDAKFDDLALSRVYWEDYRNNNRSQIFNIFYGQNRSVLQCLTCGKVSTSFDAFACVPVAINVKNMYSFDVTVAFAEVRFSIKLRVRVAAGSSVLNVQQEVHQALEHARSSNPDIPECKSPYAMVTMSSYGIRKLFEVVEAPKKPDPYYYSSYYADSNKLTMIVSPSIQKDVEADLAAAEMAVKKQNEPRERREGAAAAPAAAATAEPAAPATSTTIPTDGGEAATATSPNAPDTAAPENPLPAVQPLPAAQPLPPGAVAIADDGTPILALPAPPNPETALVPLGSDAASTGGQNASANSTTVVAVGKPYIRFDVYVSTRLDVISRYQKNLCIPLSALRETTIGELRARINAIVTPHIRTLSTTKAITDCECAMEYYHHGYQTIRLRLDDERRVDSFPNLGERGDQLVSFEAPILDFEILPMPEPIQDSTLQTVPDNTFETPKMSLETCIESAYKSTDLTGMEQWYCPRCKQHQDARKVEQIYVLPKVLVIQLKRFQIAPDGYSMRKVEASVPYPETLDMSPCIGEHLKRDTSVCPLYDLFGVVHHSGSLSWGHYTATAKVDVIPEKPPQEGDKVTSDSDAETAISKSAAATDAAAATSEAPKDIWVDFNDSTATRVNYACAPESAYILFYRMRNPPPAATSGTFSASSSMHHPAHSS